MSTCENIETVNARELAVGDVIILMGKRYQISGFVPSSHPIIGGTRAAILPAYVSGRWHLGRYECHQCIPKEPLFYVHGEIEDGVHRQLSTGFRKREDAEKLARQWAEERYFKTWVTNIKSTPITIEEYDKNWS